MTYEQEFQFYRSEVRALQIQCGDDNEKFLDGIMNMITSRERKIRVLEEDLLSSMNDYKY